MFLLRWGREGCCTLVLFLVLSVSILSFLAMLSCAGRFPVGQQLALRGLHVVQTAFFR